MPESPLRDWLSYIIIRLTFTLALQSVHGQCEIKPVSWVNLVLLSRCSLNMFNLYFSFFSHMFLRLFISFPLHLDAPLFLMFVTSFACFFLLLSSPSLSLINTKYYWVAHGNSWKIKMPCMSDISWFFTYKNNSHFRLKSRKVFQHKIALIIEVLLR